jgi:hypothetical protein
MTEEVKMAKNNRHKSGQGRDFHAGMVRYHAWVTPTEGEKLARIAAAVGVSYGHNLLKKLANADSITYEKNGITIQIS